MFYSGEFCQNSINLCTKEDSSSWLKGMLLDNFLAVDKEYVIMAIKD